MQALTPLDADLNIIQRLDEEPNDVGGLSSSELQARFDEAGNTIKDYLNASLVPAVNRIGESVGAYDESLENITQSLDEVSAKVDDLWGTVAGGSGSGSGSGSDSSLISRLEDAEGNISRLQQTAQGFETRVQDAEGNISTLQQSAQGFETRVQNAEGDISSLQQTARSFESRVQDAEGGLSALEQTVEGFSFTVSQPSPDGNGGSHVTLTVSMGGNTWSGVVAVDGNVDISGSLSASALYAIKGDIAQLTVDTLSTSRRIPKFLARDTSPDEYIRIQEQYIRFITAETDGSYEQARDPNGNALYWEQDISGAALGMDGMPYKNGARVFTTPSITSWPVYVYRYSELQKIQLKFMNSALNEPLFVFGAGINSGTDPDRGRGYIQKQGNGFKIWYLDSNGTERGIWMGEDGARLIGFPGQAGDNQAQAAALDFSGWDGGSFSAILEDGAVIPYSVSFDSAGNPVSISGGGDALAISW